MKGFFREIILIASLLALCKAQTYQSTGSCESSQSCVYRYSSTQRSFDGAQKQTATVSAVVVSQCMSVGVYGSLDAQHYCIKVSGVKVGGNVMKNDSADEVLDPAEEDIPELDPNDSVLQKPPVSPEDKMMEGEFCFTQTEEGKIVEVTYPDGESSEAINFKKGIVAAFQTNFKETAQQEEEDTTSLHRSLYRYSKSGAETTAYRTIQSSNVQLLAGGTPTEDLQINANEKIVYDGKLLSRSQGSTTVLLTAAAGNLDLSTTQVAAAPQLKPSGAESILAKVSHYELGRAKRQAESSTYDDQTDIKEFKGEAEYSLIKVFCRPVTKRHAVLNDKSHQKKMVTDTLQASINYTLTDLRLLETLRQQIPSIWKALETLHADAEQNTLAARLHQLIALEGKYKPLPGYKPAIRDVIKFLDKLLGSDSVEDREMRNRIYPLLTIEGNFEAQLALLKSYLNSVDQEEKNGLVTHIAFTYNPHPKFIEMLKQAMESNPTSVDPLLLAFGALASDKEEQLQQLVVQELLTRMEELEAIEETDKKHPTIHTIHALGNTDSKLVIEPMLRYLHSEDIDIQLASINSLKAHSTNKRVQKHLKDIILSAQFQDQVEAIVQMLVEALDKVKNKESHNTYVDALSSIGFFEDPKLHSLVIHYLQKLGTQEALDLSEVLSFTKPDEEADNTFNIRDETTDERVRRGSDWDARSSIYDLVASYSSRRNDVRNHPKHKAYIWGKKFGISKVYAQIAAGGFAGIKLNGQGYKLFGKVIARGYAFGKSATALRAEFLRQRTGNSIYQKIYAKVVGKTLINQAGTLPAGCNTLTRNLYSANIRIFRFRYSIFIYVGTLDFYIGMNAKLNLKVRVSVCETTVKACASLIPSLTLRAEGGASATILLVVRGGIEVAASFTYQLEPEICIHYCRHATSKIKACVNVYHGWPNNYAEIYAYYQLRKFKLWPPKFKWGSKKRWSALSKRWNLRSVSRRKLWSSCDSTPVCSVPTIGPPVIINPNPIKPKPIYPSLAPVTLRPVFLARPGLRIP